MWKLRSRLNGKVGYIGRDGNWLIEPIFEDGGQFGSDRTWAMWGEKRGTLFKSGVWTPYVDGVSRMGPAHDGASIAMVDKRYGLMDESGKWIVEPQFDFMSYAGHGLFQASIAKQPITESRQGYLDTSGRWKVPPVFARVSTFAYGLAIARPAGSVSGEGYIDLDGNWVIEPKFGFPSLFVRDEFGEAATVGFRFDLPRGYQVGRIDRSGEWVLEPKFYNLGNFVAGFASARRGDIGEPFVNEDHDWGMIDRNGDWIFDPRFEGISYNGAPQVVAVLDDLYGFIGMDGRWLLEPKLDHALLPQNGLARVVFEQEVGLLDMEMNWVLKPIYDDIEDCGELIRVVRFEEESYVDRNGKPLPGSAE